LSRGNRKGIGTAEDTRIRSLPTLHRLMQNARFPVNQVRVPGECIAAENDMVLGPVLRNSGVPRNGGFLSAHTRHKSEKHHTPHCSGNSRIRMPRFHSYLRLRFDCRYCSRFAVQRITDFGPLDLFTGTFLPQSTKAGHREGRCSEGRTARVEPRSWTWRSGGSSPHGSDGFVSYQISDSWRRVEQ